MKKLILLLPIIICNFGSVFGDLDEAQTQRATELVREARLGTYYAKCFKLKTFYSDCVQNGLGSLFKEQFYYDNNKDNPTSLKKQAEILLRFGKFLEDFSKNEFCKDHSNACKEVRHLWTFLALWEHASPETIQILLEENLLHDLGISPPFKCALTNGREAVEKLLRSEKKLIDSADYGGLKTLMLAIKNNYIKIVELLLDAEVTIGDTALIFAAQNRHTEIVEQLLKHGARVNAKADDGSTALMAAAQNGCTKIVEQLLKHGARVNAKANEGGTALMVAAQNGHTEIVILLLNHGAEVNVKANDGSTALMAAAQNGHTEIVELLLKHGAKPDIRMPNNATALMIAAQNGRTKIVELLLKHGAKPDIQTTNGNTALIFAAQNGHTEIVKLLLNHNPKPNVDMQATNGFTALMFAAQKGHTEIVELLLRHGAKPDIQTTNGNTALIFAIQNGHTDIVKLLLTCKTGTPDVDARILNGFPLLIVATMGGHKGIVELLLNHGAKVDIRMPDNATALVIATMHRCTEIVELLLKHEADINAQMTNGATALIFASKNGYKEIVELLLNHGAEPDIQTTNGTTALMFASENGHKDIVKLLLASNANISVETNSGDTALILATLKGYKDIVKLLLEHIDKMKIKPKDSSIDPALMAAVDKGFKSIVELLIKGGANVNFCTKDGITPLAIAKLKGYTGIAQLLIKNGAEAKEPCLPIILINGGMPIQHILIEDLNDKAIWHYIGIRLGTEINESTLEDKELIFEISKKFFETHYFELPEKHKMVIVKCCLKSLNGSKLKNDLIAFFNSLSGTPVPVVPSKSGGTSPTQTQEGRLKKGRASARKARKGKATTPEDPFDDKTTEAPVTLPETFDTIIFNLTPGVSCKGLDIGQVDGAISIIRECCKTLNECGIEAKFTEDNHYHLKVGKYLTTLGKPHGANSSYVRYYNAIISKLFHCICLLAENNEPAPPVCICLLKKYARSGNLDTAKIKELYPVVFPLMFPEGIGGDSSEEVGNKRLLRQSCLCSH